MYFKIWTSYCGKEYYGITSNKQKKNIYDEVINVFQDLNIYIKNIRFRSRTDAQVSAYSQYFTFETNINVENIFYQIQIKIAKISNNKILFHKIQKSKKLNKTYGYKTYIYKIIDNKNAVTLNTHYFFQLTQYEIKNIQNWIKQINNKEIDYQLFCKQIKDNKRPTKQKLKIKYKKYTISTDIHETHIYITGKCFMYKQIRMLIGTLLKLSKKINKDQNIINFINNKNNIKYIYTAPAHALYLIHTK